MTSRHRPTVWPQCSQGLPGGAHTGAAGTAARDQAVTLGHARTELWVSLAVTEPLFTERGARVPAYAVLARVPFPGTSLVKRPTYSQQPHQHSSRGPAKTAHGCSQPIILPSTSTQSLGHKQDPRGPWKSWSLSVVEKEVQERKFVQSQLVAESM